MLLKRLSAPLAALAVVVFPASALAQSSIFRLPSAGANYRSDADAQVSYYEARRAAYDQGYREGLKEGEKDARSGDRFAYQDEGAFQRADKGYHRSFGDRERYRQVFRDGFATGYSEGYSRLAGYRRNDGRYGQGPYSQGPYRQQGGYGRYGDGRSGPYQSGGYYSPAFDNGARDGYEKGQEDARKRRSFDPRRHSWYRSGDRHYEGRYGSRDQYKDIYRQGFQQGYEQGFREGRFSW